MSEGKEIKFKFVVDEQSAQRVNRVLDDMIKRAQELAKTLSSVGGMGGGGGGLMGGGSVGGKSPSNQSTMATAPQSQKVSFASVLSQNVDVFRKMATEGGSAMKAMTDALKRGAAQQQTAVDKLAKELDALGKMYDKVGGKASGAFGEKLQGMIFGKAKEVQGARGELAKLRAAEGRLFPGPRDDIPLGPEGAGGGGMFSRFRGFLNQGGGVGGSPLTAQGLAKVPGLGGVMSGLGGVGGLAGGGALAGVGLLAAVSVKAAMAAASGAYNAPTLGQNARVDAAGVGASSYARKLRRGDLSDVRAMGDIESDQDKRREFGELKGEGGGFWNWTRRQGIGLEAGKRAFGRGELGDAIGNVFSGTDSVDAQNVIKGRNRDYVNKTIEERGVEEDIMADATGGAMGKMAMMRALGVGGGRKKDKKGKRTGEYVSNAEKLLNAFGQFSPEEVTAAVSGIGASGQRSQAYSQGKIPGNLSTVLQATAAGIGGSANIAGIMGRQGARTGGNFVDLMRSQQGQDVSTTALLGGYVASKADTMNAGGFSGAGLLGTLSYRTQGDAGGMIARQNIAGQESFGRDLGGKRDAAQAAQNLQFAKKNAPDAGYYAQEYLATKLDASRMAEVLGGDFELTGEEKALGITGTMLRAQAKSVKAGQSFRTMKKGFQPGSEAYKMTEAEQGGESSLDYIMRTQSGDDKKLSLDEEQKAIDLKATIIRAGDPSMSWGDAQGKARVQIFGHGHRARVGGAADREMKKGLKGDVAGGSRESKVAKEEAEIRETERHVKDAYEDKIEEQVGGMSAAHKRLLGVSSNLAIDATTIAGIISTMATNLKKALGGPAAAGNDANKKAAVKK